MRALLIHNPSAGMRTDYNALQSALVVMREAGWEVEARETHAGGDATNLARQAAQSDYGAVFAVGGDGTLNEVMNGVLGSDTALGVLPYGTANVWAKEMGLPLNDMAAAARVQVYAPAVPVDVGQVRGESFGPRAFLLWCGVGFDAHITAEIEPQRALKRRLGALMFWLVGIRAAFTFRGRRAQVNVDGNKRRFTFCSPSPATHNCTAGWYAFPPRRKLTTVCSTWQFSAGRACGAQAGTCYAFSSDGTYGFPMWNITARVRLPSAVLDSRCTWTPNPLERHPYKFRSILKPCACSFRQRRTVHYLRMNHR
jgi:diacylglycerol kinase-like protein